MLGALIGIKQLPEHMIKATLECDCTKGVFGPRRPEFLNVKKYGLENIKKLVACRPKDSKFEIV